MYNITQYDAPVLAGIQKVLARDTASILENDSHGIFLRDTVSGAYMIASDGTGWGIQCLLDHEQEKYSLLSVCADRTLTDYAAHRYGLGSVLDCYQAIYRQTEAPVCRYVARVKRILPGYVPITICCLSRRLPAS